MTLPRERRLLRGGSVFLHARYVRCAQRTALAPVFRPVYYGLRPVAKPKKATP
jgi:formylglycine-generating enzyme required for sulfatase activity